MFTKKSASCALLLASCNAFASSTTALEEIVITSSRVPEPWSEIATAITKLSKEDLDYYGHLSLVDVLQYQPSMSVTHTGGAGKAATVRIRGEEGYRTLVVLDGIPLTDTSGTQHSPRLEHLTTQSLTSVEILRGPQGLMYGADAGGIIYLSSKPSQAGWSNTVSLETGRYNQQSLFAKSAISGEHGYLQASWQNSSLDGFNASTADTATKDSDGYDNDTKHLSGSWQASNNLQLSVVHRTTSATNEYDACYNASFQVTHDCTDQYDSKAHQISANYTGDNAMHRLSYSQSQTDKAFYSDKAFSFGARGKLRSLAWASKLDLNERIHAVVGADADQSELNDGSLTRKRDQLGVYAELKWAPIDTLTLAAGARTDDNDDFGRHNSIRLTGTAVQPLNDSVLKYKISYGTGFRAPSLYEVAYNAGPYAYGLATTTQLKEERSAGFDIGVEWLVNADLHVQATYFRQTVEDEIFFDLEAYTGYLQDDGEALVSGLELSADWAVTEGLTVATNATMMNSERPDGSARIYRPDNQAALSVRYSHPQHKLSGQIAIQYRGDSRGIVNQSIDGYTALSFKLQYALTRDLKPYLRVENALDADTREIPGYYASRAAIYAGVSYQF
jgi:vitamin B12 transporter